MQKRLIPHLLLATLFCAAPTVGPAFADTIDMPPGKPGRHQGPPPEFFQACNEKEAGETVSIETPRGDLIKAVCEQKGDQLVARPVNPPQQPPEE